MANNKVVIAGGTGLIGRALTQHLSLKGYDVFVLSRNSGKGKSILWDGKNIGPWADELNNCKAVINLSGKSINCRPTKKNKREILTSRVESTEIIGRAIAKCSNPPEVWINSSAIGYYGDTKNVVVSESDPAGKDYIAQVCVKWENALFSASTPSTRKVAMRTGMVLSKNGGALPELIKFTKFGLGGEAGSGSQFVSWIHLTDLINIFELAISNPELKGPINAISPEVISNKEMMKTLRKVYKAPFGIPQPAFVLRLGAWMIDTYPDLVLFSSRLIPQALLKIKYKYLIPKFEDAIK